MVMVVVLGWTLSFAVADNGFGLFVFLEWAKQSGQRTMFYWSLSEDSTRSAGENRWMARWTGEWAFNIRVKEITLMWTLMWHNCFQVILGFRIMDEFESHLKPTIAWHDFRKKTLHYRSHDYQWKMGEWTNDYITNGLFDEKELK